MCTANYLSISLNNFILMRWKRKGIKQVLENVSISIHPGAVETSIHFRGSVLDPHSWLSHSRLKISLCVTTKKWWLLGDCNKLVTQTLRMGNYFPSQVHCTGRLVGGNQSPHNSGQGQTECNLNNCRQIYKCTLQ